MDGGCAFVACISIVFAVSVDFGLTVSRVFARKMEKQRVIRQRQVNRSRGDGAHVCTRAWPPRH